MTALRQQEPCYASVNLISQWRSCYRRALGMFEEESDEKQKRTSSNNSNKKIRLTSLLRAEQRDDESSNVERTAAKPKPHQDVWMESALEIDANMNDMARWIVQKKVAFASLEMPQDEASLIQSTVTSFVATTATEIESLRNLIAQQQTTTPSPPPPPPPPPQRAHHLQGMVEILLGRLKEEIAEPFGRLQKQRHRKAVQLWQKPLQCSLRQLQPALCKNDSQDDPLDAVLGLDSVTKTDQTCSLPARQQFLPKRPTHRLHRDFLASYQLDDDDGNTKATTTMRALKKRQSALFRKRPHNKDDDDDDDEHSNNNKLSSPKPSEPKRLRKEQTHANHRLLHQQQQQQTMKQQPLDDDDDDSFYYTTNPEQQQQEQLQQEAALLTASIQQGDLDSVQQMESMMVDITTLLSQFAELVSAQQEQFIDIADATATAKHHVAAGQDELVDAKERTQQSHHYMARAIAGMGLLLLLFHWVRA